MTPLQFKSAWATDVFELIPFSREEVQTVQIPDQERDFLIEIGLPADAAPFLNFGGKNVLHLPTAGKFIQHEGVLTQFRVIGSNAYGDPICIDESSGGTIVYLNHDDSMRACFMNSSVSQLAYSLLAFRNLIEITNASAKPSTYFEGIRIPEFMNQWIHQLEAIDSRAIQPETFWHRQGIG